MALRNIVVEGDEILRKTCREVGEVTDRIRETLDDMVDTMHEAMGVGLAAPQVGVLRRVVVIETEEDGLFELINPVIILREGVHKSLEGCLSLPGKCGITERPEHVIAEAYDRHGKKYTIDAHGLLAKAICHELDHLDGVLYSDIALKMLTPEEYERYKDGETVE